MMYQYHLITYEHLEWQQIAGEPVMDDYQEDAIMEAENRRQAYVSRTGMRVTNSIINDTVELVMFLSGPAWWKLLRKVDNNIFIVRLSSGTDDESDHHTSGNSTKEESE